jgi:hypothetical protein
MSFREHTPHRLWGQCGVWATAAAGIRRNYLFFRNLYSTPTEMAKLTSVCVILLP